jgi:hypothetical protein
MKRPKSAAKSFEENALVFHDGTDEVAGQHHVKKRNKSNKINKGLEIVFDPKAHK